MAFVGWYALMVGIAITGIWTRLLATDEVEEISHGDVAIRFHLAAEFITAFLLMTSGIALLLDQGAGTITFTGIALGALAYTTINSAGYYAARKEWGFVTAFVVLILVTAGAIVVLVSTA